MVLVLVPNIGHMHFVMPYILKNRLPHTALKYITPYEKMNGRKPDLSRMRTFGARAHYMHKERGKKLDRMDSEGTFMTFKGTDKIAYVIDSKTGQEQTTTHIAYDEAYSTTLRSQQPPMATALYQAGYQPQLETAQPKLQVKLLSNNGLPPVRGSNSAAGLDIHTSEDAVIAVGEQSKIGTKIALEIPTGYHGQLMVRSSYASKYRARVETGTIDADYRGEIFILISNHGDQPIIIKKGERIAQLLIIEDPKVSIEITHELNDTIRGDGGFGSTGKSELLTKAGTPPSSLPTGIPNNTVLKHNRQSITAQAATLHDGDASPVCNIDLSYDPFHDIQEVIIDKKGNHPTLGMILNDSDTWNDNVIITTCQSGTPATKIKNWRKRMKGSTLMEINNTPITSIQQATKIISDLPPQAIVRLKIGLLEKLPMHDDNGVPMMYFDQLNTIATHLQHIQNGKEDNRINKQETRQHSTNPIIKAIKTLQNSTNDTMNAITGILPKSKIQSKWLTRRKVKQSKEWETWKLAEWQQLDQYYGQKMFGEPCKLPKGANALNLIWNYDIKSDGRLKARMVCNGRPSNKNTVIFGYTYAKSLDHVGSRVFWAAAKNYIVRGANASNAFAEADAPKIPLYVRLNDQYREWWVEKMKRPEIPQGYVLPVQKALQGHPEAPRAWAILIDTILKKTTPQSHYTRTMPILWYL
jgi:dUTP pyrophosphatase